MGFSGQYGTLILYAFHASSVPWFVSCVSILFFTLVTLLTRRHTPRQADTPHTPHGHASHIQRTSTGVGIWIRLCSIRSAQEPRQSSMSAETGGPSELRMVRCASRGDRTWKCLESCAHSATRHAPSATATPERYSRGRFTTPEPRLNEGQHVKLRNFLRTSTLSCEHRLRSVKGDDFGRTRGDFC